LRCDDDDDDDNWSNRLPQPTKEEEKRDEIILVVVAILPEHALLNIAILVFVLVSVLPERIEKERTVTVRIVATTATTAVNNTLQKLLFRVFCRRRRRLCFSPTISFCCRSRCRLV